MRNAKEELLNILKDKPKIKCAEIEFGEYEDKTRLVIKVGYTEQELNEFLTSINRKYDSGYGGQELFGYVWLEDGTWFERGEYDGSEWWEYKKVREIPDELK